jgi:hypothetical protein
MENEFVVPITRQSQPAQPQNVPQKKELTYPTEMISLPSQGHFYPVGHPLSSGEIEMKLMTAKEEDILMNQNLIKKGMVLDKLLESLLVDKSIKLDDILLCDKNALYIAARRLAYGDNYGPVDIKCEKCGEKNETNINISEFQPKEFDFAKYEPNKNSFAFVLPYSKKTITYKLLTHADDRLIDNELKASAKIYKSNGSNELTTRLKYVITSVDGIEDRIEIKKFIESEMTSRDSLALRTQIKENTPDIDTTFNFVCEHCSNEERMGMPVTVSFFWPEAGK